MPRLYAYLVVFLPCVLVLVVLLGTCAPAPPETVEWPAWHGDVHNRQYSPLDQIDTANVGELQVAWHYRDPPGEHERTNKHNPLMIGGTLYGINGQSHVIALDARTGAPRWTFDPRERQPDGSTFAMRGLHYWREGDDERILFVFGTRIYALDAATGELVPSFGDKGLADFLQGLDLEAPVYVSLTSPGVVFDDLLITGSSVPEQLPSAPGHIRAFEIKTGELAWRFRTIPAPGEFGYATWSPDSYRKLGGANAWAGLSLDEERATVYVPTGSPTYDFYGGDRIGENLFANCVLALDARTGERKWHFQAVHHDLWDLDLACPPNLITVRHGGREIDAVAQFTKSGHLFVLDRDTGEPLFPVEEVPVPTTPHVAGERPWPTQPIPSAPPPVSRSLVNDSELTDLSPAATAHVRAELETYHYGEAFIPPTLEGTVALPSYVGGPGWGGAAWDEASGLLVVNSNDFPWIIRLFDLREALAAGTGLDGERLYGIHCGGCHGEDRRGGHYVPELLSAPDRFNFREVSGIITEGRGLMGALPQLAAEEVAAISAYVLGLDPARVAPASVGTATDTIRSPPTYASPYYSKGYTAFRDPDGRPAIKPPWGTLTAVDVNAGTIAWQVPLGEDAELSARGLPPTGLRNQGGPIVTAGGLVFIAATGDRKFRAFDLRTGELRWETTLPGKGSATPTTYAIDGKQYLVIAVTGSGYLAFALPD